jgi:hypothetical protein
VWSYRLLLGRFTRSTLDTSDLRHKLKVLRYLVSAAIQSLLKAASNDTDLPGIGNQPCQRLSNLVYGRNCRRLEKTVETREETCRIKSRADSTTNASQDISKHSLLLFLTVEGDDRVILSKQVRSHLIGTLIYVLASCRLDRASLQVHLNQLAD